MSIIRKVTVLILLGVGSLLSAAENSASKQKAIFVGVQVCDYDRLLPSFLKSIDNIDYDKDCMALQFTLCSDSPVSKALVSEWVSENGYRYESVNIEDRSAQFSDDIAEIDIRRAYGQIKNLYLVNSRAYRHCLILSSECFIAPKTLKTLIEKDKPIIAPLLRPTPKPHDPYRNFFCDVTENGYYKDHGDYLPIANREKLGVFTVPLVQNVYLIQTAFADDLSFTDGFVDWEFIAFSNNARKNSVDQYICNENEFGFLVRPKDVLTKEERRQFFLVGADKEVDFDVMHSILSLHYADDPVLKDYVQSFDCSEYAIYRVDNQDLFYVDEVNDYIKNYRVKCGAPWEEHIAQQFKSHVKPGSVVLDIGGHIGTHTLTLSKIVGDAGRVHVFEPQAKLFCELAVNMHLNDCKNVKCYHNALGSEEKWIEMHIPKEAWTAGISQNLINEGHGTVSEVLTTGDRTKMLRLDDLQLDGISFIKIDVEGYEMEVIRGGKETILRNKPVMIIEIFAGPERAPRLQEIENLGYTYTSLGGDDYLFVPSSISA